MSNYMGNKYTPRLEQFNINIDGVKLILQIDYTTAQVSFMNRDNRPSEFIFANRSREYLGGWIKIIQAIEEATRWADARLERELEARKTREMQKKINILEETFHDDDDDGLRF